MKIVDMVSDWRFKRWCVVENEDSIENSHNHMIKQFDSLEEAEEYLYKLLMNVRANESEHRMSSGTKAEERWINDRYSFYSNNDYLR